MTCKNCSTKPVIRLTNTNIHLCKSCFTKYFERKALKTIRIFNLIDKEDNIAVALSGGKDSLSVLYFLNKLAEKRKKLKLQAVLIDEGIKNYRDYTIKDAKKFCNENNITLNIYSFKKEFSYTLDELIKNLKIKPCTICGVLRRYLLNKKSRELKINKLATGHNLDDETQSIIMNQFRRNIELSARLGPLTGVQLHKSFIRRIKPFYLLTEKETATYSFLKNLTSKYVECPYESYSYRCEVRDMLNDFEKNHEGTKHSIVQSFLEILPLLKEKYKEGKIKLCKTCKEPCSQDECQACKIIKKLK